MVVVGKKDIVVRVVMACMIVGVPVIDVVVNDC